MSPEYGAIRYVQHIPSADLHVLPSGGHFIFLECNGITTVVDWFNGEFDLCGTNRNVDREKVRDEVSAIAVSFLLNGSQQWCHSESCRRQSVTAQT